MTARALPTLGISGTSIHTKGQEGREIEPISARLDAKAHRFSMLRVSQRLLHRRDASADDQHETVWCHRTSLRSEGAVEVMRAVDGSGARLGGVSTCGNVWSCPVCCAKVAEQRRHEVSHGMAQHVKAGGHAYLLTFTFPHDRHDQLADLMAKLDKARQRFQNQRLWKAWKEGAERVGGITSLEVTYGSNGWHPHLHMLVFVKPQAFGEGAPVNAFGDLDSPLIREMASLWVTCLEKAGLCSRAKLGDAMKHAFNVRGGTAAAEYVAKYGRDSKWGQSSELTRQHAKAGRRRLGDAWHATPFEILSLLLDDHDAELSRAFREYVAAFKGRRMLVWSPGLKRHFGIGDLDDEQLAAEGVEPAPDEARVAQLSYRQFVQVVACNKVGALLSFVARYGGQEWAQDQVDAWIGLECRMPTDDGTVRRRMEGMNRYTVLDPN